MTPVVGQTYDVPCVLDAYHHWVPVFPTPHHDQDHEFFSDVEEHYHVDTRFMDFDQHQVLRNCGQMMEVRPRVCLRETHTPPERIIWLRLALLEHFKNHELRNCAVCPHKGMPIHNGVCAGHGLRWGPDGRLVNRGPFRLRLKGTNNIGPITNLFRIEVPIIEAYDGPMIYEILDSNNQLVLEHHDGPEHMGWIVGDLLYVTNENARRLGIHESDIAT